MDLKDTINELAEKAAGLRQKGNVSEEATKMALIVPMLEAMGYDTRNIDEVCPEYTAAYGVKKGEKVDYAILMDDEPVILIECKPCTEPLDSHVNQLFSYYGATPAKFGILTNGVEYWFYTDLETVNQMDTEPFLTLNIENITDSQITALGKFCKDAFNKDAILSDAERMKYTSRITDYLAQQYDEMDDSFAGFVIKEAGAYSGHALTSNKLSQTKPLVQKAFTALINDQVNKRISQALNESDKASPAPAEEAPQEEPKSKIVTTKEEIESFFIIRGILAGTTPIEDITYKDTATYFGILYQGNSWKPICRLYLDMKQPQIGINTGETDENGRKCFNYYHINSLNDLYKYKKELVEAVRRYTNG